MNLRIFRALVLLGMSCSMVKAQGLVDKTLFANVVPPSPTTQEFEKYIMHPVSPYNGIPEISIPLYTIEIGGIKIPLALSYHASGIKHNQLSGDVGIGWVLNPGYRVSRTMYGRKDEGYEMPVLQDPYAFTSKEDRDIYLSRIAFADEGGATNVPSGTGTPIDSEYDIFSYSLLNTSGSFIIVDRMNKKTMMGNGDPLLLDYEVADIRNGKRIVSLNVTDADGMKYRFGKNDAGDMTGVEEFAFQNSPAKEGYMAWAIRTITTPFNDVVTFDYVTHNEITYTPSLSVTLQESADIRGSFNCIKENFFGAPKLESWYVVPSLKSINTDHETITFSRTSDNTIQFIEVRDKVGDLIKRIEFFYSAAAGYNYLDKVIVHGSDDNIAEPLEYSFDYQRASSLIGYDYDHWGYIRMPGTEGKSDALPQELGEYSIYGAATGDCYQMPIRVDQVDRSNGTILGLTFMGKDINKGVTTNMLVKVTYPSKGFTEYSYESNKFLDDSGVPQLGPGLRIAEIRSYDYGAAEEPSIITTYKYGQNENGAGKMKYQPRPEYMANERLMFYYSGEADVFTSARNIDYITMYATEAFRDFASTGIMYYPELSIYYNGAQYGQRNGKEKYVYETAFGNDYEQYRTNSSAKLGRQGMLTFGRRYRSTFVRTHKLYKNAPNLLSKEYYDKDGNRIQREEFTYKTTNLTEFNGLKVRQFASNVDGTVVDYFYSDFQLESFYDCAIYTVVGGIDRMVGKTTTAFVDNMPTTTVQEQYSYNSIGQLKTEKVIDNVGSFNVLEYTYPGDYSGLTSSDEKSLGVSKLQNLNVLTPIVEKTQWKVFGNSKYLLSGQFNTYLSFQPLTRSIMAIESVMPLSDFEPSHVENGALVVDDRYQMKALFDAYDGKGNVQQRHLQDGVFYSYLWDYQYRYPVAEVVNAGMADVAHTSFETTERGNWLFAGSPVLDLSQSCPTGVNVYNLSGAAISKFNLSPSVIYVLSYWKKSDATVNVSGGDEISYRVGEVRKGWVRIEHQVKVNTSVLLISGSGFIDELRLHPLSAQITTYTYKPFVGVTSAMDTNGNVQYFEYDGLGRLVVQRDKDRNIIKRYNYRYKK